MVKDSDILLVGLVPPPFHGQSIATKMLFDHDFKDFKVERLEVRYSNDLSQIGKISWDKISHMFKLIGSCWRIQRKTGARTLYYTPTSASLIPFVRDVAFLSLCRPLFKKVILHYHAGGLPEFLECNILLRSIGRYIYGRGATSIALTEYVRVPDEEFGASEVCVVPNGVYVPNLDESAEDEKNEKVLKILYVANLYRDKGILEAIHAVEEVSALQQTSIEFIVAGVFPDKVFERELKQLKDKLSFKLTFVGLVDGAEKWTYFRNSDVFIFPSYYASENQPLVLIEAMAAGLPVIASRWRGIPSLVKHLETGMLVEPKDHDSLVNSIRVLLEDPKLRASMGVKARVMYEQYHTPAAHIEGVSKVMKQALADSNL